MITAKLRRNQRRRRRLAEKSTRERIEQHGRLCIYCARTMTLEIPALYPTRDHVEPKSKGGTITVWACLTCNAVKRNMTEEQWALYRGTHPEWWLSSRARKAANWTPRRRIDNMPSIPSETGPEAEGTGDALTA